MTIDPEQLRIVRYPDPRLRRISAPVPDDAFGPTLHALVTRMFEIMREQKGVGLAAPQVGVNRRLFVMNATGEPGDDRAYINPVLTPSDADLASEEAEEGCLSLPNVTIPVLRARTTRLVARDADGRPVDLTESGFASRVWQHEVDHLDGILLIDKMGPVGKMTFRKTLRELEEAFAERSANAKRATPFGLPPYVR